MSLSQRAEPHLFFVLRYSIIEKQPEDSGLLGQIKKFARDKYMNETFYVQEHAAHEFGLKLAGEDEVGRGCLAGPVAAAAVIMNDDPDSYIQGIDDSKKLSEKKREELYGKIAENALCYNVAFVSREYIDEHGILPATRLAFQEAIAGLKMQPDKVMCDYITGLKLDVPHDAVIKGDAKIYSIAAASIIAKVERDRYMREMAKTYPEYGFEKHKGYGTKQHREALEKFGPCPMHRRTFITKISMPERMKSLNNTIGKLGENNAALFLESEGYDILERNYRCTGSELDIIARKDDTLVCVEVKSGREYGGRPAVHVNADKKNAMRRGLEKYIYDSNLMERGIAHVRIDVIEVYFDSDDKVTMLEHTQNAVTY